MNNKETTAKYSKYLYNKRVIVIGGADNYDEAIIDDFDIAVWPNGFGHYLRHRGAPVDVFYIGLGNKTEEEAISTAREFEDALSFVFWNAIFYEDVRKEAEALTGIEHGLVALGEWGKANPYGVECEGLNILHNWFGGTFFTGVAAMAHICSFMPKEVFATGMTLYVEDGLPMNKFKGVHYLAASVRYLKFLHICDHRVTLDMPIVRAIEVYEARGS